MAAARNQDKGTRSVYGRRAGRPPVLDNGRRRWQWAGGLAALVLVVLMMLALLPDPTNPFFQGFDLWWRSIANGPAGYQPSGFVWFFNAFGGPAGLIVMLVLMTGLAIARRWWAILFTFLVYTVPMVFAQVLKNLVDRPRPENPLVIVDHGSFPSGHATSTAAFVVLVGVLFSPAVRRYWWPVGVVFVLVMLWTRTFLGAHWLSDTLAGAVLGTGVTLLLWWLCAPLLARDDSRTARRKQATPIPLPELSNAKEPTP